MGEAAEAADRVKEGLACEASRGFPLVTFIAQHSHSSVNGRLRAITTLLDLFTHIFFPNDRNCLVKRYTSRSKEKVFNTAVRSSFYAINKRAPSYIIRVQPHNPDTLS